jgi:DNA-directed RNA polymerase subunit RPC12/RpoP
MEMVTLRTFDNYFAAHILLGRLKDAGIHCFLKDEHTVTTNPVWGNAVGGIKLQVPVIDIDNAKAILEALDTEYRNNAVCQRCGQKGLDYMHKQSTKNIFSAIATYLFGGFAMAPQHEYVCSRCGWRSPDLPATSPEAEQDLERAALAVPPEE